MKRFRIAVLAIFLGGLFGSFPTSPPSASAMQPAPVYSSLLTANQANNQRDSILVQPTSGLVTSENGGTNTFTMQLGSQPSSAVHISLRSSDPSEGRLSAASLVLNPGNWDKPQTITVTGIDDNVQDGDIHYQVVTAPAVSNDSRYNQMDPADVSVMNQDDDFAPVANDDLSTTNEDTPVTTNVLANDTRLNNDTLLTVSIAARPSHGSAAVNTDRTITYTPDLDFNGSDNYQYQVCNTAIFCDIASVSITVTPVNDNPVAKPDTVTTPEDQALTIDILANDSDVDGDALTIQSLTQPGSGSAAINGSNQVVYTPNPNFNGSDSFTYKVSDGHGGAASATVRVSVSPVNDPPVAHDDSLSMTQGPSITIAVLSNDSDPDGDTLLLESFDSVSANGGTIQRDDHGTPGDKSDDRLRYTPPANFSGIDTFTYRASDGDLQSDPATIHITVPDLQAPTLTWVSPAQDEERYDVEAGTVLLKVQASDNMAVERVHFSRWDAVRQLYVELGDVDEAPYQLNLDVDSLNYNWNQVFATAYDTSGNSSPRQFIWIYRIPKYLLYIPAARR